MVDDDGATRTVVSGAPDGAAEFPNNLVRNTKYTPGNFLLKNVAEQFERPLNRYFLLIACLQMVPILAPVNPLSTWVPLLMAFGLTAAKEGLDDLARHKQDKEFNTREYWVADAAGALQLKASQDISVGDVVKVCRGDEIPCDLVLLQSSDEDGVAYIRTDNLDGEIDLKERTVAQPAAMEPVKAVGVTKEARPYDVRSLQGLSVTCEVPNAKIYAFNSLLSVRGASIPLSSAQLLLQSCFLINTEWVLGVAVYTGAQTKAGMNKQAPPVKWAGVDRQVSRYSVFVLCFQIMLALVMGFLGNVWWGDLTSHWYLALEPLAWYEVFVIPIRFFLLTSVMIPSSFKVIIDISKYYISLAIGWDAEMYSAEVEADEGGCPAKANNTAIAEDLGQIEYLLTDKTGTLTDNVMTFKACSLGGVICGGGLGLAGADTTFDPAVSPFADVQFARRTDKVYLDFAKALALCHGVNVNTDGSYSAASPDEEALVKAACDMGVVLTARSKTALTISVRGVEETYDILHVFEFNSDRKMMSILLRDSATHATTLLSKGADDKMIARMVDASAKGSECEATLSEHLSTFAVKGLRTLVYGRRDVDGGFYEGWKQRLQHASCQTGVRRDLETAQCYSEIETGFELVGATAIEDKLQDGVPETITTLRQAGIAIWMLTGDKYETAMQIAHSCGLWTNEQTMDLRAHPTAERPREEIVKDLTKAVNVLAHRAAEGCKPISRAATRSSTPARMTARDYGTFKRMMDCCRDIAGPALSPRRRQKTRTSTDTSTTDIESAHFARATNGTSMVSGRDVESMSYRTRGGRASPAPSLTVVRAEEEEAEGYVLFVEGAALDTLLDPSHIKDLKQLCMEMRSIVFYRVTPGQKAAITRMAKTADENLEAACCLSPFLRSDFENDKTVLSVGDGGNDVSMIQEATIGVGIVGKEGKQASRAADYQIGRFRFLRPLLLVHGQYSYQRSCFITQYCFYKSFALAFVQMLFNGSAGFSGVSYWTSLMLVNWNGLYTLPQPFLYVLDRIAPRRALLTKPELYAEPQCGAGMTAASFFLGNLLVGILHSVACYVVTVRVFSGDSVSRNAMPVDFRALSTVTFTALMMVQAWVVVLSSHTLTVWNLLAVFGMPVVGVVGTLLLSSFPFLEYYQVGQHVLGDAATWLVVVLLTFGLMAPSFALTYAARLYFPTPLQTAWYSHRDADGDETPVELGEVSGPLAASSSGSSPYRPMQ